MVWPARFKESRVIQSRVQTAGSLCRGQSSNKSGKGRKKKTAVTENLLDLRQQAVGE